jgi:cardiolipin synthase
MMAPVIREGEVRLVARFNAHPIVLRGRLAHPPCLTDYRGTMHDSKEHFCLGLVLDAEVSLAIYDSDVVAHLRVEQEHTIENSETLMLEKWVQRSLWKKVAENMARLVSPLL